MYVISEEEKKQVLNSVNNFADEFFACTYGKIFVKLLAEVIKATAPDAGILWEDSFYSSKEEFKEVVEKILRALVERA